MRAAIAPPNDPRWAQLNPIQIRLTFARACEIPSTALRPNVGNAKKQASDHTTTARNCRQTAADARVAATARLRYEDDGLIYSSLSTRRDGFK
jgi:hypothetical protein